MSLYTGELIYGGAYIRGGLYTGGLIHGRTYIRTKFCVTVNEKKYKPYCINNIKIQSVISNNRHYYINGYGLIYERAYIRGGLYSEWPKRW